MADQADIMAVASAADTASGIERLPNELLQAVWIHLDDPAAWAQTCKRFRELSKDTLWRAKWFMQRYKVYEVIFYAIARPKIFKSALLDHLLRFGAPLSRNLLQLVYLMRNTAACSELHFVPCNSAANDLTGEGSGWPRWGRIDLSSYAAVLCHGARLDPVPDDFFKFDSYIFMSWLKPFYRGADQSEVAVLEAQVKEAFETASFMPLPLTMTLIPYGDDDGSFAIGRRHDDATKTVKASPSLTTLVIKNGYAVTIKQSQSITKSWFKNVRGDNLSTVRMALKKLKIDGIVHVPECLAEAILDCKLSDHRRLNEPENMDDASSSKIRDCLKKDSAIWGLLAELEHESALPFSLQDVTEAVTAKLQRKEEEKKAAA